ncbi:MAG: FAD-binding oxidoreductase [Candidatus Dormibacteraceae bacterium]
MVIDGVQAPDEAHPRTQDELAAALQDANSAGRAVIPVGGGRALGMGAPPERFDLALHTTALDRLVDYTPTDLTVTVEAGMRLEALQRVLGEAGQFLPLDPFGGPGHTIGGLLATAWSGPLRLRYGTARDYLIGLRVALADGRLARSGGRVVKNVSGYDLNKLHLGALGSLGVIVEASFKVFPAPLHEETLVATPATAALAWSEAERALALAMPPVALELVREGGRHRLLARVAGSADGVRRIVGELGWESAPASSWTRHAAHGSADWARLSVRPGDIRGLVATLPEAAHWIAAPGAGVVHWLDVKDADTFLAARTAAVAAGGSAVLLAAPVAFKKAVGAWGAAPPTLDLMRRMKAAFDPRGTLSPGRYLV